ncbi:ABC transporter ATP-binding protein [Pseudochryseolinea flava]|uniref:ABC transporter ATP-binding protein n=1 Tax=Pseudochryseolinea flava TaxID=2059302 RepID=A0A364Y6P6_9BACT|nr:ABC transporter ATP-binding protein [Pseudochryseolinea flava]RAW02610.1 ABC transporter ATP-binding protein [Pseudochryseolinea flava]
MDQRIIELTGLTKKYGQFTAVDHLTLSISKGEIFGLLGPNGAGKSTTILMMLGLTEPTSGVVKVCGKDPVRQPVEVKRKVGYLPDSVGFYDDYSGLENLIYTAQLNGINRTRAADLAESLLKRVGLSHDAHKKAGTYSRGMRQRLGLADVLIKRPEVIILDEPTLGIDPEGIVELLTLIRELSKEQGITILLSSHHLHQVQEVCDRIGLFVKGKLLAEGNITALAQQLFSHQPYSIEASVVFPDSNGMAKQKLTDTISRIEGVLSVELDDNKYRIGCSRNVAPAIARSITAQGADLMHLHNVEYGLSDIYHHYFKETATP